MISDLSINVIVANEPFNDQCSHHIESSQMIFRANQLTGFYMMGTLVVKGLMSKRKQLLSSNSTIETLEKDI